MAYDIYIYIYIYLTSRTSIDIYIYIYIYSKEYMLSINTSIDRYQNHRDQIKGQEQRMIYNYIYIYHESSTYCDCVRSCFVSVDDCKVEKEGATHALLPRAFPVIAPRQMNIYIIYRSIDQIRYIYIYI